MGGSGFRKLFWGFLFTMLDFRIIGIDILPDIIGYFLFLDGLNLLILRDEVFKDAKKYCVPLIILSVFTLYDPPKELGASLTSIGVVVLVASIAETIVNLSLVYNICQGIRSLAYSQNNVYLAQEADNKWKQYVGFFIASIAVVVLIIIPPLLLIGLIGIIIYAIVLLVLMTRFMLRCREELENNIL